MSGAVGFIDCFYEACSGAVFYVWVEAAQDDRVVSEAEALALLGADAYSGSVGAERRLAQARRVQCPAVLSTDRRSFTVLVADEAPVLLDGDPYVRGAA